MIITGFSNEYRFIDQSGADIILDAIPTKEDRELPLENKYVLRCYFPSKSNLEYIDMFIIYPDNTYDRVLEEEMDDEHWDLAYDWCLIHRNLCIVKLENPQLNC